MNTCEHIESGDSAVTTTDSLPINAITFHTDSKRGTLTEALIQRGVLSRDLVSWVPFCTPTTSHTTVARAASAHASNVSDADVVVIELGASNTLTTLKQLSPQIAPDTLVVIASSEVSLVDARQALGRSGYLAIVATTPALSCVRSLVITTHDDLTASPETAKLLSTILTACGDSQSFNGKDFTVFSVAATLAYALPAFIAKYVTHQAQVCQQQESEIVTGLRRYIEVLETPDGKGADTLSVGDLWSGLLWWRDERSWIGRVGFFTRTQITGLAAGGLRGYLSMLDAGMSDVEISASVTNGENAPELAKRLLAELTCDSSAPGLRAIVSHAVCRLIGKPE